MDVDQMNMLSPEQEIARLEVRLAQDERAAAIRGRMERLQQDKIACNARHAQDAMPPPAQLLFTAQERISPTRSIRQPTENDETAQRAVCALPMHSAGVEKGAQMTASACAYSRELTCSQNQRTRTRDIVRRATPTIILGQFSDEQYAHLGPTPGT
ncbi:uncharacterized protein N7498_010313 [Penicillium cinerascens]|uniref:Uncharacterized protein n=1 Tax=Penicillium cinerascens TaxID=70096 RepID=A0A9W9J775_9EURO|nr:uncharacterized protein N7498_010313 [Penicillium cinerascens]KAJ5191328.1 hypothetical protein N7498_010313 [Penicillium cinerascens]